MFETRPPTAAPVPSASAGQKLSSSFFGRLDAAPVPVGVAGELLWRPGGLWAVGIGGSVGDYGRHRFVGVSVRIWGCGCSGPGGTCALGDLRDGQLKLRGPRAMISVKIRGIASE